MKNHFAFLGLPKPKLKAVIKPYIRKAAKEENIDWGFVDACWQKNYRESQYAGIEYLIAVQNKLTEPD